MDIVSYEDDEECYGISQASTRTRTQESGHYPSRAMVAKHSILMEIKDYISL